MRTTVIYHSADFDGLFCREIARKFLPEAELIGWDYGDPKIPFPADGTVYVLDLAPDCLQPAVPAPPNTDCLSRMIWIDHHKSAIEKFDAAIPGYRIDGVAACRLAWQWFAESMATSPDTGQPIRRDVLKSPAYLPQKKDFIDRTVSEPYAVRLAGEYDIWDKRDPNAELFQHGLKSQSLSPHQWGLLLKNDISFVDQLLDQGTVLRYARDREYNEVITQQGFDVQFEGLTFLACNSHELDIRSQLFEAGIKPHHDGLLGFTFTGKDWRVSLYGVPGKPEIDLSPIAVKYGGGGHRQACGFRVPKTNFVAWLTINLKHERKRHDRA